MKHKLEMSTVCSCTGGVCQSGRGEDDNKVCENAMTFVECSGDLDKKGKSGDSNCCIGTGCGNRRISQHNWCGKIKVFDTKSHGWGVTASDTIVTDR
jgi:hypothetical protein